MPSMCVLMYHGTAVVVYCLLFRGDTLLVILFFAGAVRCSQRLGQLVQGSGETGGCKGLCSYYGTSVPQPPANICLTAMHA